MKIYCGACGERHIELSTLRVNEVLKDSYFQFFSPGMREIAEDIRDAHSEQWGDPEFAVVGTIVACGGCSAIRFISIDGRHHQFIGVMANQFKSMVIAGSLKTDADQSPLEEQ